jgi:hypothetical protein
VISAVCLLLEAVQEDQNLIHTEALSSSDCLLLEAVEEDQNLIHTEALSSSDSFPFRDMCTNELVLLQGDNKNTKYITRFLCRNNFTPMNGAITC